MKIEIWSDVMCPFCYIGKHKFERALNQFTQKESIQVEWKSFQLNPDLKTDISVDINQYLMENKGISYEQAKHMNETVTALANKIGLTFQLDKAIVCNTFMAHRFSHLAKSIGKQEQAEELLFRAYFSEGKNVADQATLVSIGMELGLAASAVNALFETDAYFFEVEQDLKEAKSFGINSVPFFVFDRKFSISGAQESAIFLKTLQQIQAQETV
jgi:predicted DsbA family dithiol-disulfide isomerase